MNAIGRIVIIRDKTEKCPVYASALVVDSFKDRIKRVRLQTGTHAGEMRQRHQFDVMEYVKDGEAPPAMAEAFAEAWME